MTQKERNRAYYKKHKKKLRQQNKEYYYKHLKEQRKYRKKYYKQNKEKIIKQTIKWAKDNKKIKRKINRKYHLKKMYGMTESCFNKLLSSQNGKCAICKKKHSQNLVVDHNHTTGKIRGLLCGPCNLGIGNLKENINYLREAIKYLMGR